MDATTTPTPARWCGWARNGSRGKWRCLVRGTALPEGRHPDDRAGR